MNIRFYTLGVKSSTVYTNTVEHCLTNVVSGKKDGNAKFRCGVKVNLLCMMFGMRKRLKSGSDREIEWRLWWASLKKLTFEEQRL